MISGKLFRQSKSDCYIENGTKAWLCFESFYVGNLGGQEYKLKSVPCGLTIKSLLVFVTAEVVAKSWNPG